MTAQYFEKYQRLLADFCWQHREKIATFAVISAFATPAALLPMHPYLGLLVIIPSVFYSYFRGIKAALFSIVTASIILFISQMHWAGLPWDWTTENFAISILGFLVLSMVSIIIGYMSELNNRLKYAQHRQLEYAEILSRRAKEAEALAQVTQGISSTLNPSTILYEIVTQTQALILADLVCIARYIPEDGLLAMVAVEGQYSEELERLQRPIQGIITRMMQMDHSVRINEVNIHEVLEGQHGDLERILEKEQIKSVICTPISAGGTREGVLWAFRRTTEPFTERDEKLLDQFAFQAAIALRNARLYSGLVDAYEQQQELDRMKDQFLITMHHELRTPLTAVHGYIELLAEYGNRIGESTTNEFIKRARHGCDELLLLLENVSDASKLGSGKKTIRSEALDTNAIIQTTVDLLALQAQQTRHVLVNNIQGTHIIWADEARLRQILINLLTNAMKYSPEQTEIVISAYQRTPFVEICVQDSGHGIPESEKVSIFQKFTRLEQDLNSPVRGVGLGLYVCKELIEAMGGKIWVTDNVDHTPGCTMHLTLPIPQTVKNSDLEITSPNKALQKLKRSAKPGAA